MFGSLAGEAVIVTGASKGIGVGIARTFVQQGANVLLVARSQQGLDRCAEDLSQYPGEVATFACDVSDPAATKAMAGRCQERFGGVRILCANAGIYPSASLEEMTPAQWDEVMQTNVRGTFLSVQSVIPFMKLDDWGRIILTSSITGPITGYPGWSHYSASKAAQLGFMRTACLELAKYNITVNAILPGNIYTEGLADLGEDYLASMAKSIPLRRLGTVEDIGFTALFLASREAGYLTGQSIVVDGGQVIPESLEALEAS